MCCLFQANYNHNNKFLGKAMMDHAIHHGHIAKEQCSAPFKQSISHALNKTPYFDKDMDNIVPAA